MKKLIKNPFIYDKEVSGQYFCGRTHDINQVLGHIQNGVNVIMFAKKRLGKSSLIKEIFQNHLDENVLRAHIDIYAISSTKELYDKIKDGIAQSLKGRENSLDTLYEKAMDLQTYFRDLKVSLKLTPIPSFEIEPTSRKYIEAIGSILSGYFNYLEDNKLYSVIAIDEFQKIVALSENDKIEAVLRTAISKRKNCSFIFSGSRRNWLFEMFNSHERPFYKLGIEHHLKSIDKEVFYQWTLENFKKKDILIDKDAFDYIYSESCGETRFIQLAAYKLFESEEEMVAVDKVKMKSYIDEIVHNHCSAATLYNTFSIVQQNALKIIAKQGGVNLYSKEVLDEFEIKKGSLQSAIDRLVKSGDIYESNGKYSFENIELGMWLKRA